MSDHISTLHAESRTIAFEKIRSRLPLGVFIVFPLLRMCVLGAVLLLTIISTAWAADQTVTLRTRRRVGAHA